MATNALIEDLDINSSEVPRVTNALKREGINDAFTLAKWTEAQLLTIHNIGDNDILRIREALHELGLDLAG